MRERWDGIRPASSFENPEMNSFNHYAFGAVGDWMYQNIGGISLDPAAPGYRRSRIAPRPGGGGPDERERIPRNPVRTADPGGGPRANPSRAGPDRSGETGRGG